MKSYKLSSNEYYDKVYGCWLGKNIGGTLGGPDEGIQKLLNLSFYPQSHNGPLPNDDLDLQLIWLHALEAYGPSLTAVQLGQEWVEHNFLPPGEYAYASAHLRRKVLPPVSGWFNNPFKDCMGSPIRSEIWAMVAPGVPGVAAYYAWQDAVVDHAGGEGVYGEMFFSAIQSAAFVMSGRDELIALGLSYMPEDCLTARAVKDVIRWHQQGKNWFETRELLIAHYNGFNFTYAPLNIGFIILGWLYGSDFEDAILKTVNCGYDTDCTAATLGAIFGILHGRHGFPERWVKPLGNRVAINPEVNGFPVPSTLDELTTRTMKVCRQVLAYWDVPLYILEDTPTDLSTDLLDLHDPRELWCASYSSHRFLFPQGSRSHPGLEVVVDYGADGPTIGKNQSKGLTFTLFNHSSVLLEGEVELSVPEHFSQGAMLRGFVLEPGQKMTWTHEVRANEQLEPFHELKLSVHRYHDDRVWTTEHVFLSLVASLHWMVSGPDEPQRKPIICSGNEIEFGKGISTELPGTYRACTTMVNAVDRVIKFIVGTACPVRAFLNGELLIDDQRWTNFRPALTANMKCKEIFVPAGEHILEIEAIKDADPLVVYFLPGAPEKTKTPGPFYYLTDLLFV